MRTAVKHQPATPLPWRVSSDAKLRILGALHTGSRTIREQAGTGQCVNDAIYIAHAANAYPKLVAALNLAYSRLDDKAAREEIGALLNGLGEAS